MSITTDMSGFPDDELVWHKFTGLTADDITIWTSTREHWRDAPFTIMPMVYPDGRVSSQFAGYDNINRRILFNDAENLEAAKQGVAEYIAKTRHGYAWEEDEAVDYAALRDRMASREGKPRR